MYPVPVVQNTSLPGQWQYQGCLKYVPTSTYSSSISLTSLFREAGANRTFPYQNIWTNNNTVEACLNQCALFGYPAAGMEYSDECCGLIVLAATQCAYTWAEQGVVTCRTLSNTVQALEPSPIAQCRVPVTQFTCVAGQIGCR